MDSKLFLKGAFPLPNQQHQSTEVLPKTWHITPKRAQLWSLDPF